MDNNIDNFYKLIGQNIKKVRNEHHDSQEKFAEKIDMSRGFISQVESPKLSRGVSLDTLFKIAQLYEIDIRCFFEGYESLNKKDSN